MYHATTPEWLFFVAGICIILGTLACATIFIALRMRR